MADFDVISYLASKGKRGRAASGGREMVYPCWFDCEEPPDSRKLKLYVHVEDGFYNCKVCNVSGGSYMLQKYFGDEPRQGSNDEPFTRRRILDHATARGEEMLANNDAVLHYLLRERGLSPETIVERKLGFVAGGWSLVGTLPEGISVEAVRTSGLVYRDGPRQDRDFFYRHILIPFLSRGHVISMRAKAWGDIQGGKYLTGQGDTPRLYNADTLDGAEDAIITEGEFDTMILAQTLAGAPEARLRRIAVVSLSGVNAIPEDFDDLMREVKRIYIGFDSDGAGRKAAEALKERIGTRARILQLPFDDDRKCDWTEYLLPEQAPEGHSTWKSEHPYAGHGWRDVHRLLSSAAGKRIYSIYEAGEAFRTYRETNTGVQTGYGELDAILNPGLLPGQVVVILAKTGAGKTVFLCNLAYNMRQRPLLMVSLEMTREEIYDRLRRIFLFHHPEASDLDVEDGLKNIYICDENRLGEKDLSILIAEFRIEAEVTPEVVMIDYLGYYSRGAKGNSPYEKATNGIMQLKAEAKSGRYVVIVPSQVNRFAKEGKRIDLDDARDSGAVEETADFLMALWRPDDAHIDEDSVLKDHRTPTGAVNLTLLKSRHGGKGKEVKLVMDLLTLAVVPAGTSKAARVKAHNNDITLTWDMLRRRETAPIQRELEGIPRGFA